MGAAASRSSRGGTTSTGWSQALVGPVVAVAAAPRLHVEPAVDIYVTRGLISFKGRVRAELPAPRMRLTGDVDVDDFAATDAAKRQELLSWRSLHVGGFALSTTPYVLAIREVALTVLTRG